MNWEYAKRSAHVAACLLTHPNQIPRYFDMMEKMPLDLELPWMPFEAIDHLTEFVTPQTSVCEFGSGGSTLYLAPRVGQMLSLEENPEWAEMVRARIAQHGYTNVDHRLTAFDFTQPEALEGSQYLANVAEDARFDLIVVDCTDYHTHRARPICFYFAQQHINPGGLIVVDDSWRYVDLRKKNEAKRVITVSGVGPGRRYTSTTDFYYY